MKNKQKLKNIENDQLYNNHKLSEKERELQNIVRQKAQEKRKNEKKR